MSILTLGYSFEGKLNDININGQHTAACDDNFKRLLAEIEKEFQQDTQLLTDIKELNSEDLNILNQKIKGFNIDFDRLNNIYYDISYFGDGELKQLFTSISRQVHKVENLSHKYPYLNRVSVPTPHYIKEALAKLSQEAIGNKLSSKS